MKRSKGFTLIELLVAMAVIAILATIALPAYGNYVKRGKIAEATSTLSGLRVSMEQYYQDNRTYLNGANCGVAMPISPAVKYFTFACVATANTFGITATGTGDMLNFAYTIDQQNAKTSTITASGWTGNGVCWATKPDGSC